jgi:aminoglycoside phosphotransferase
VVPQWVLEIVSKKSGGEYGEKFEIYAKMGVLYYAIYNLEYGRRDKHEVFELYRLENGRYMRQVGEPVWMPELGLGIGRVVGWHEGIEREWLYWYDEQGNQYPAPRDAMVQERALRQAIERQWRAEQQARLEAEQQLQQLLAQLRQRGIDLDSL